MMQMMLAAAGGGVSVDDVFSAFTYSGNSTNRTITNNINLSGEGGAVWIKGRDVNNSHYLFDTERGVTDVLNPDSNLYESGGVANSLTAFNSDGFDLGTNTNINDSSNDYIAWTWRKQSRFFDVVTYTGNSTAGRTISHDLGCVPGFIWVKNLSQSDDWYCYHPGTGNTKILRLNSNSYPLVRSPGAWNDTSPTSSVFTVGTDDEVNKTGENYVAYLFAEDEQLIKCGSYTGDGENSNTINVGFEPQFLLIKAAPTNFNSNWFMYDTARGIGTAANADKLLKADVTHAEESTDFINLTSTGFTITGSVGSINANNITHVYMAIAAP